MFSKFMKIIEVLSNPRLFKMLLSMNYNGYLKEIGWIESFKMKMPVDKDLKPIPWMTYPFIDFISDRLSPDMEIFEYGSGNSTLYFASKVKWVYSIEHKVSIKRLKPEGVIVLDDSERPQYLEGIRFLLNEGFRKN
jgi:hypothetical protein